MPWQKDQTQYLRTTVYTGMYRYITGTKLTKFYRCVHLGENSHLIEVVVLGFPPISPASPKTAFQKGRGGILQPAPPFFFFDVQAARPVKLVSLQPGIQFVCQNMSRSTNGKKACPNTHGNAATLGYSSHFGHLQRFFKIELSLGIFPITTKFALLEVERWLQRNTLSIWHISQSWLHN